jgi:hypothetical protein
MSGYHGAARGPAAGFPPPGFVGTGVRCHACSLHALQRLLELARMAMAAVKLRFFAENYGMRTFGAVS